MAVAHRCRCCGRFFRPDPRKRKGRNKQRVCGRELCRRTHQRRRKQDWERRHPDRGKSRRLKVRGWAKGYPDYWRRYRAEHPAYRERERLRQRRQRARLRRVAKPTVTREILVEKLLAVKGPTPGRVANPTVIARRMAALVDVLVWRERVAKPDLMGKGASPGRQWRA